MKEDYLLKSSFAKRLFDEYAKEMPVIDYHNHLNMGDLISDKQYEDISELWVMSDPYKHRVMRICGVEEKYITGDSQNVEKYNAWMNTLPKLIGNPLYDWSILEMKRVFDIDLEPGKTKAEALWDQTNSMLKESAFSARPILEKFNVDYTAPVAALTDDIRGYENFSNIAPSLRGDNIANPDSQTIESIESETGADIRNLQDFYDGVILRLDSFEVAGCKFSDHSLDNGFVYYTDDGKNAQRFAQLREGKALEVDDKAKLTSEILRFLASEYARRDWTMQLHIGAQRSTSSRLRDLAGAAGGYAGIGNSVNVKSLTTMLDDFEKNQQGLPKTILLTLNPTDNAIMSTLSGSYSQDGVAGKVQQGAAWWWCDHVYGMQELFNSFSSFSVLSTFLGMTTDSRSVLSFVRHEYFRRTLCGWLANKVDNNEMLASEEMLGKLVQDISYNNLKNRIQ